MRKLPPASRLPGLVGIIHLRFCSSVVALLGLADRFGDSVSNHCSVCGSVTPPYLNIADLRCSIFFCFSPAKVAAVNRSQRLCVSLHEPPLVGQPARTSALGRQQSQAQELLLESWMLEAYG